ncbi:LOW QUALITY PROTEIN: hypothetical protein U9M48_004588 [Paspalum notatum var. saurae]|uniref:TTF-type domain-containing protein n=1 Tax=Paspalum notatum var. saurae TaxID=547442 RepID=A0AAQ3PTL2_PASNO
MDKFLVKKDASTSKVSTKESCVEQKRPRIELNMDDIVVDPGLRKPIDEFHHDIRDDAKRAYLAMGPCQPIGHKFPRTEGKTQTRGFVQSWFKEFEWLEYSIAKDAAYCFYCYLFKPSRANDFGNDVFTKVGYKNWKKAKDMFKEHAQAIDGCHNIARQRALDFKNQRQSVGRVWSRTSTLREVQYKGRLTVMLGIARFLLLQALAFRGHNESKTSSNKGNFLEMLEWYRKKDPNFAMVTSDNAPGNNQMTCPEMQKDLARACAEETSEVIKSEIGDRYFSVLVDEARDASIKEQMALVVRYVDDKGQVIERFLGIQHVPDTTAVSLKVALVSVLGKYGLSISKLRGQGYDGASNMRWQFHGLLVLDENPYTFYIYCFAHQLQLVVVSIAKCCGSIYDFFNYTTLIVTTVSASCKRINQLLQDHHKKLVEQLDSGDTRWGTHHRTLVRLKLMWSSVLEVLENISKDANDGEKRTQASGLIERMETFEFMFILHLMIKVLGKTQDLSQCLQRKNQNIVRAIGLIGAVLNSMNDMRENGWNPLFDEVKSFCLKMNIVMPNMEEMIPTRWRSRCRGTKLEANPPGSLDDELRSMVDAARSGAVEPLP